MIEKKLSLVVSVYNEQASLPLFYDALTSEIALLPCTIEILFVNDGSSDQSSTILQKLCKEDGRVRVIQFSRNFGHEAAMLAGIDYCKGDLAICLDADLQHPPSYIKQMYEAYLDGKDIVTMVREDREDGGWFRKITSSLFYSIINKLTDTKLEPNASDFFMISRRVIELLKTEYRERNRFIRGFIQMVGFNKTQISFTAPKRVAGESKYSFFKLIMLSFSAITTLSKTPLKLGMWCGLSFGALGLIVAIYTFIQWITDKPVSGYTTIVIVVSLMFCINFIVMGIIAEYVATLFDEAKKRPPYIVMEILEKEKGELK